MTAQRLRRFGEPTSIAYVVLLKHTMAITSFYCARKRQIRIYHLRPFAI